MNALTVSGSTECTTQFGSVTPAQNWRISSQNVAFVQLQKSPGGDRGFHNQMIEAQALPPAPPQPPPPSQSQKPRTGSAAREAFENNVIQPSSVISASLQNRENII
jgi:hypothetical protein